MEPVSQLLTESLIESTKITLLIFVMMIIVELFVIKFKNKIIKKIDSKSVKKTSFPHSLA
ncbi:MAG: hypothetical protein PWP03_708 [Candidatus Woesearchaeota archaeon]|nr:hypothetical protein [Candidatus Woesearchaeota archaeon]MDN5328070.1 hypothetical protein [Candidatus Woesearchaeota archaeon]